MTGALLTPRAGTSRTCSSPCSLRTLPRLALFKVNTGTREQEVCGLRWEWEEAVPELGTSVFVVPGTRTKNREDRVVVLNRIARSVVDGRRGEHPASRWRLGACCSATKNGNITTHYSAPELRELLHAAEQSKSASARKKVKDWCYCVGQRVFEKKTHANKKTSSWRFP